MSKLAGLFSTAAALALVVAPAALRADDKDRGAKVLRSVDVTDKYVTNSKGEALGHVEDCVINLKDGKIVYCAVAYGETLGFGGKLFAVAPGAMKLSDDGRNFVWEVNKADLDAAQGYDANKWPTQADTKWMSGKLGDKPAERTNENKDNAKGGVDMAAHLARLSALKGLAVRNNDNESLGTIQAFGLDCHNHKVAYGALAYGGVAGIGSKYFAIPWNALELKSPDLKPGSRVFVINARKSDFEGAPGFDYNSFPQQADEKFSRAGTR